jgi:outer membrane protein assembly factor BamB
MHSSKRMLAAPIAAAIAAAACARTAVTNAPGVIGHVYALDARDGAVVWRFDVVPASGPAQESWPTAPRYPVSGGASQIIVYGVSP